MKLRGNDSYFAELQATLIYLHLQPIDVSGKKTQSPILNKIRSVIYQQTEGISLEVLFTPRN